MVRDIRYIIKRVIIGVLISFCMFFIRSCNVHASTLKEIRYYDANFNLLYSGASTTIVAVRNNFSYIRMYFSNANLINGHTYNTSLVYNISEVGHQPYIQSSSGSGVFANGAQKIAFPTNTKTLEARQVGSNTYFRSISANFQWNHQSSVSPIDSYFISLHLTNAGTITGFNIDGFTLYDGGVTSTSSNSVTKNDINSINETNNNNTNSIIANNNNNTNTINSSINAGANKINDSITDNTAPSNEEVKDLFNIDIGDSSSPVSDLITMPLTLLQAYTNGFNASCTSVNLGSLYGHNLTLPCIEPQRYLGSNLWGLIDMCVSLFLAYNVGLMCVSIYEGITSLQDSFYDLYTPEHGPGSADAHYKPKHGGDS